MKNKTLILSIVLNICFSQWFDIEVDGVNREYLISYPISASEPSPLIINMHGYTSNAYAQLYYSQMDDYALPQNIAVVYPQGMNNVQGISSWNVGSNWDGNFYDDVGFISEMIEKINEDFSIDLDRVYACGMSNGGYMTYELACELSDKIAAFGSVTGNFMLNSNQNCNNGREIPIIHLHGTADAVVNYNPPSFDGALTVSESIDYWSNFNNLTLLSSEDLNNEVEKFIFSSETSSTQFVHFKVTGGQHEWFGTSWGFHTSDELINFFLEYRLSHFVNNILIGDLNENGTVNIQDIIIVINIILGQIIPSEGQEFLGDLNEDEIINVTDIILLVQLILN